VVAVSPLVKGDVLKGPTAAFMRSAGWPLTSAGIASAYGDLIDGLIADQRTRLVPVLLTDVLMDSPAARRRLADDTVRFALGLG
jgi:LPPG:FO 2-phospho-L-lactate transferase